MPLREVPLIDGEYYHIFNRGVAKQDIFTKPKHYVRFERTMEYYQNTRPPLRFSRFLQLKFQAIARRKPQTVVEQTKQVEIVAYTLMTNHFHLLLKQTQESGISNFMRNLGNSYTRYFNTVSNRLGPLFQGSFKAVHIESESQLIHLSRYVHINQVVGGLVKKKDIDSYPYSSYSQYVNNISSSTVVVQPECILSLFSNRAEYKKFCLDYTDYALTIASLKHSLFDGED